MIDIHCHILPAIDDGAKSLDEALEMARIAVEGGTEIIFTTPHLRTAQEFAQAGDIAGQVAALQAHLDAEAIPLRLLPGAEVYPVEGVMEALEAGDPLTLGASPYILLDSLFTVLPTWLEQLVFDLQLHNITPILAHPERVAPIQDNPRILETLVQRGLMLQVNTTSVTGTFGPLVADTAHMLLEHRWVAFLASDAHSSGGRRPGQAAAFAVIAEWVDEAYARSLAFENGRHLLAGTPIPFAPQEFREPRKKRRWWFR